MIEVYREINALLDKGETFAIATVVRTEGSTPRGPGAKMIIKKNGETYGTIGGGGVESAVIYEAQQALQERNPRVVSYTLEDTTEGSIGMICGGKMEVAIELLQPTPTLLIIGSGYIAEPLAKLGAMTGYKVNVIDPYLEKERFPDADEVIREEVESGLSKVDINSQTYVVIATRHIYDEPALKGVIDSEAAYIGMVGSENRVNTIFETLRKEGISEESLRRVHAPIGLNIGAETPEEIAVSIISEVIKVLRGGTGESMAPK